MQKSWKDLIRPNRLEVEKETLTPTYGKFTAENEKDNFNTSGDSGSSWCYDVTNDSNGRNIRHN